MSAGSSESALNSPQVEPVAARDAWRMAEVFTAGGPECDVVVGSGDSMLPLYPDQTVLLIRRLPIADLRSGMTVVFIGDRGRPVAHLLVKKTDHGWLAKGLANLEADRTLVRAQNYLGTVVRAFCPVMGRAAASTVAATEAAAGGQ